MNRSSQRTCFALATLFAILVCEEKSGAQDIDERHFVRYTQQDGLSHNTITDLLQDSVGYIWMSTYSGLNRFNGSSFVQMRSFSDSFRQTGTLVRGLQWLDSHRIAAYSTGMQVMDTRTGEAHDVLVPWKDPAYQYKFNGIRAVQGNVNGDLFVLTYSGFYHFDRNYRLIFRYDHYRPDQVANTSFAFGRSMYTLSADRLLITSANGLYCYDIAKKWFRPMQAPDAPQLAGFLSYPTKDFIFLQPQAGRLLVIDPAGNRMHFIDLDRDTHVRSALPANIDRTSFGWRSVLLALNDSVMLVSGQQAGVYRIGLHITGDSARLESSLLFPAMACRALLLDRDRQLWMATNKGLLRQEKRLAYISQIQLPPALLDSFPNIGIGDINAIGDRLYIGTRGNGGLLVYDRRSLRFIRRMSFARMGPTADNIYSLLATSSDELLIGPNGPLISLNTHNGAFSQVPLEHWNQDSDWVADIHRDRRDNIWVASGNIYTRKPGETAFHMLKTHTDPYTQIQEANSVREDAAGNIWIGGHGLLRYNVAKGDFDRLIDSFPSIRMPDRRIVSVATDDHNNLWFNSYNNGLCCYNPAKGITHHFTTADGLPDNNISAMTLIGNKLWIGSYSGICCLDLTNFQIKGFGKEDGFPDLPITNGARFYYDTAASRLYIGFSNVLSAFDPEIIYHRDKAPDLFIERLVTGRNNSLLYPGREVMVAWQDRDIRLTIGSLNFLDGASSRYAYRIADAEDRPWLDLGTQNTIGISSLSSGLHRVQVKLYATDNRWPARIRELDIQVTPPFWETTWFIALVVILLLSGIVLLIRWNTAITLKNEKAKQKELAGINEQLAEAQLSALQAQMNPHFIFNSLNSIKGMILENEQQKASRYLSKFAQMIRTTLNQSKSAFTTLHENIGHLETYLMMEKLRFDDSFTFRISVDETIDPEETLIPTLMIQPLAENAIWHGLMPGQGVKRLSIRFSMEEETISCIISDNGIGIHAAGERRKQTRQLHQSTGLANLRKRIKIMNEKYDMGCSLEIEDWSELDVNKTGTRVELRFKILTNKPVI